MPSSLTSVEWATLNHYRREIEDFKGRQDLTDQEVIVMEWMQQKVNALNERT